MTDHQHPTAKPEANWRTCSRAEYDALPDLSAKPEGEGTPVEQVKAQELLANNNRRMDAYYYGFDPTGVPEIDAVLSAVATAGKAYHHTDSWSDDDCGFSYSGLIQAAANLAASRLSASPPVTAVAGAWDSLIDYLENQTAETEEGRAIIAEWIAQAKALNAPTPSSDQSGVIGALVEALKPLARLEVPKRTVGNAGTYSILHSHIRAAQAALAAHAASIGAKS